MNGRLPRRDFILIPLLAIATVLFMMVAAEIGSRAAFVETGTESCGYLDKAKGWKPNCVSRRKTAEGPMVENAYNDCGYRTPTTCGTPAPGTLRVALMGTSTAEGFKVRFEDTFAARLTDSLSRACGRPVEFQNMGVAGVSPLDVYRRTDEALAMKPDLIMLVLSAVELKGRPTAADFAGWDKPPPPPSPDVTPPENPSWVARISDLAYNSRALVVAQHFLFQDRATYVRLYMLHGEDADYLRPPLSQAWRERLSFLEQLIGGMVAKARAHGVPMLVVWAPTRIQAALTADKTALQGVDPFAIGHAAAEVSAAKGAAFLDTLNEFARDPAPERLFYAVDGHLNAAGSAVFATAVQDRLTAGDIAPFSGCQAAPRRTALRAASPG